MLKKKYRGENVLELQLPESWRSAIESFCPIDQKTFKKSWVPFATYTPTAAAVSFRHFDISCSIFGLH
jgi:hypothetical protein